MRRKNSFYAPNRTKSTGSDALNAPQSGALNARGFRLAVPRGYSRRAPGSAVLINLIKLCFFNRWRRIASTRLDRHRTDEGSGSRSRDRDPPVT